MARFRLLLCVFIAVYLLSLIIGVYLGFRFVSKIYLDRLKEINDLNLSISDPVAILTNIKILTDYSEPIKYTGVGVTILVTIAIFLFSYIQKETAQFTVLFIILVVLAGIFGGFVFGDGLAAYTFHNVLLNSIKIGNNFSEIVKIAAYEYDSCREKFFEVLWLNLRNFI